MSTSPNEDGRPTQGGAAAPVHVMNPISVTLAGTIPGTVEVANDSGNPIPVSVADGADVALGTTTDAAVVTSVPGTVIGFLRGLISLLVAKITVIIAGAGGTPVQLDDTDKLAVSLYGKASGGAAGDTPVSVESSGLLRVTVLRSDNAAPTAGQGNTDAISATTTILPTGGVFSSLYNGSTLDSWDRQRNNHEVTALASAARTASVDSADLVNYNSRGVIVVVDITALTATGTLTVTIQGKDTLSGKYYTLLASTLLAATGTTVLVVYPGTTIAANLDANSPLPRVWRVSVVAGNGVSITYSVGCNYIN